MNRPKTQTNQASQIIHDPEYTRRLAASLAVHAIKHTSGDFLRSLMDISKGLAEYANMLEQHIKETQE